MAGGTDPRRNSMRASRRSDGAPAAGSGSLENPTYWWYVARVGLLETVLGPHVRPGARVLDVGSADGPSADWLGDRVAVDIDRRGLRAGGVCGRIEALPFSDDRFEVVSAFDVIEHCEDDVLALAELRRVAKPGGRIMLSVPAYQWLWSAFDVRAGHHRRYTRPRLRRTVEAAGLSVDRATYVFASTFPFFVAVRLLTKLKRSAGDRIQPLPAGVERTLLLLSRFDEALLRRWSLPVGSSVVLLARKLAS